jgi:TolB-like protein/tetratricopeptide (TPR) repeat protein/predicted Ser/Thr protein kinase
MEEEPLVSRSPASLQPGDKLGPYAIEGRLGSGGMGDVYRATDTRLRRTVAIKLLAGDHAARPDMRERFLREARSASALNHANIILIHDICQHAGCDFIVMEFVDGQNLKEIIAERPLPLKQVADVGAQIASALDAAHAAGIVHRDIKPANVMVTEDHRVKVLDFGVAKAVGATMDSGSEETRTTEHATQIGTVVGTVAYMSPEQTRGEAVEPRSDIFSLGSLLYEIATGTLPFQGATSFAIMHEIMTVNPAPPSSLKHDLPAGFDHLVAKCLEKIPARRPGRAADVSDALKALTASRKPAKVSAPAGDGRKTVAVVPLQFRNAAGEDKFLSVALADAIANRLGSAPSLVVRPTTSVVKYAQTQADWTRVARELNVDLVVEGSIQKMGTRVRTLVQVWEFRDSRALHSAKIDGDMGDLFGLQDRLADTVFDAMVPPAPVSHTQADATRTAAPPAARHPLAYELYMRAVDRSVCFNKFDLLAAIEMLNRAVDLDPTFADAWGLLANIAFQMGAHIDQDPKWFSMTDYAVARALELDPVNCDAFCAQGSVLWTPVRGFQSRPALRALNAALKVNPSRYAARSFRSAVLFHHGFHEAAFEDCEESSLARPDFALAQVSRAYITMYTGQNDLSEIYVDKALALEPALVHANIHSPLPSIYLGDLGKARERLNRARKMIPEEPQLLSMEGLILAREGDFDRAERLADEGAASNRSLLHTHHCWHTAADVYALCGKADKAITQLKRCAENGLPNYRAFEKDAHLVSLRNHPEFQSLMRTLRRDYEAFRQEFDLRETHPIR